tara:strand:- start:5617 stop:8169 length:2553 start_codon:yes stop_codon:yes gene_type:complete
MDERWLPDPQDALYIQDMTWTPNDSWRTSGGFIQVYKPNLLSLFEETETTIEVVEEEGNLQGRDSDPESVAVTTTTTTTVTTDINMLGDDAFGTINSIHWFAQHNGARQWLIFEEVNAEYNKNTDQIEPSDKVTLKAFYGSIAKSFADSPLENKPVIDLKQYLLSEKSTSVTNIDDRIRTDLSTRTQSQSYGGRIYLVNGSDEPLVFDGEVCERAGFADKPPSPTGLAGEYKSSTTIPIAVGDWDDNVEVKDSVEILGTEYEVKDYYATEVNGIGFYSLHKNLPYWGLGAVSDATIGAGSYRFKGASITPRDDAEFDNAIQLRAGYYAKEQIDTRKCGFQYKVTYVNDRGQESEASASSSIMTVYNGRGGAKNALHGKSMISINLPVGPKECVARRIYRTRNVYDSTGNLYTKGDQRSFYFLQEITDNMTTQFADGHPDTALGALLDEDMLGSFPSKTKFLAVFKNTMFAAGSDLNEIRFSAPLFPEVFPKDNVLIVGDDDGGQITGMRTTKDALVVFKTRGIYLIKGDPLNGFQAKTLNKDIGCIAPDSISELPGLGLAFLSERSVYLLEGALENTGTITSVVNIGGEIPNQLERLNTAASIRASSAVYQKDKEYWLSVPIDGSDKNNYCLIYHYSVGSWSIRKDFPVDCMVVSKDHRGYLFMGSNDANNDSRAGILVYTRGASTKGDVTLTRDPTTFEPTASTPIEIESIYETVSNDYESVFSNFRPAHVMAYAVGYGDNGLTVNTRVNRSIDQVRTTKQIAEQQDPNEVYPVYGSAVYGEDRWTSYRPTVIRFDVSTTHKGPVRELSVSFASAVNNKIEIIGYDLEAKYGEQRNIKPLNKALRPSGR